MCIAALYLIPFRISVVIVIDRTKPKAAMLIKVAKAIVQCFPVVK